MNKQTTQIASVPLIDAEAAAVAILAHAFGVPGAGVFRLGLIELARKHDPKLAASLLKSRLTHAVSVTAKACRHAIILAVAFTIPILSAQGVEMRRCRSIRPSVVRSFRRESNLIGGAI